MAGASSGHLVDSSNHGIVSQGSMSFNSTMHGTQPSQPFSMFASQGSMAFQGLSEATAIKIASLQAKLNQKLGPEYISTRPGPGGGPKLTYAEGWKVINLANEVFGFNGWSSNVISLTTDFMDLNEESKRYNIGVTAIVRVTLRDGVYHEDIGYGMIENTKSKGQGLDKCKKEAVTDGLKRALRSFGNLLGNCLYDKSYTQEVVKMKVAPAKFDQSQLHRRPEFEEKKSNIASVSTVNQTHPTSGSATIDTHPQDTSGNSALVTIKKEPVIQPRSMPPPPAPVLAQDAAATPQRRVNFETPDISVASVSAQDSQDADEDEAFNGFFDDDEFLASVDLEDLGAPIPTEDLGRPIAEDTDMGPPLHYADTSEDCVSVSVPPQPITANPPNRQNARPSAAGKNSRLEAIIAAQIQERREGVLQENPLTSSVSSSIGAKPMDNISGPSRMSIPTPNQFLGQQHGRHLLPAAGSNENRDPAHGLGVNAQRRPQTPIGGFHFPSGPVANSMQSSSRASTSAIAVKRPLDTTASNGHRGTRPGMGLQQATSGVTDLAASSRRQVLGRLDNGDGGDIKRIRR